jgi:hypothetical protein
MLLFFHRKHKRDQITKKTLNVYAQNNKDRKYQKQNLTELNRKVDKSTVMVGYFSIPLSVIDRITKHVGKNKEVLKDCLPMVPN